MSVCCLAKLQVQPVRVGIQPHHTAAAFCKPSQAQALLGNLGITSTRLAVPPVSDMAPLLTQLQPHQRLLLLHYNAAQQELCIAAWGVPRASADGAAAAATLVSGPGAASSATTTAAAAAGGSESARSKRLSAAADAATALGAGTDAQQQPVLLSSMRCPALELADLMAAFRAYRRKLQKEIVRVTSQPPPKPASSDDAARTAAAASGTKKAAPAGAGAAGKAGSKDKASKLDAAASEAAPWVPPVAMFDQQLNEEWHALLLRVRGLGTCGFISVAWRLLGCADRLPFNDSPTTVRVRACRWRRCCSPWPMCCQRLCARHQQPPLLTPWRHQQPPSLAPRRQAAGPQRQAALQQRQPRLGPSCCRCSCCWTRSSIAFLGRPCRL